MIDWYNIPELLYEELLYETKARMQTCTKLKVPLIKGELALEKSLTTPDFNGELTKFNLVHRGLSPRRFID